MRACSAGRHKRRRALLSQVLTCIIRESSECGRQFHGRGSKRKIQAANKCSWHGSGPSPDASKVPLPVPARPSRWQMDLPNADGQLLIRPSLPLAQAFVSAQIGFHSLASLTFALPPSRFISRFMKNILINQLLSRFHCRPPSLQNIFPSARTCASISNSKVAFE